ncbi:hypothetical protein Vadar_005108 [Vaccinium darrowii]|uniref:Uncharacterized protein n=1 Tax=Vaccinium darrowii TaxID=229202 RepID=A0ACB7YCU2_9ERIC|nr:hypothetical protein Vadar_005108 [Vaccinium darrowii]
MASSYGSGGVRRWLTRRWYSLSGLELLVDILKAASRRLISFRRVQTVSTMAAEEEVVGSVKGQLVQLFEASLRITVPDQTNTEPLIAACNPRFGDYQCNNAMSLWTKIKGKGSAFKGPQPVGQAIMTNLLPSEMIDTCSIAGPGFVNVILSTQWIAKSIQKMLIKGIETWSPKLRVKRAVVDFSSPNIAKEMHVGHLRSTIIGDTLARMLEFSNVEVLRRNHVGDWGTQFGMLIEYLFEKFPNMEVVSDQAIGDLEAFYKASKQRFDSDPVFKERAQHAVVSLQGGEERYRKAWSKICEISRQGYERVYERLGIGLEEKGESFYNLYIPGVLEELNQKGLIEESEGARVIKIEGKSYPFIVVKSDGGFNYASTDLTALWYRLNEEKAEWMIYVTDVGQREHFEMLCTAAKRAGWLPPADNSYPKASHVGFGLVLGEDGKRFQTRTSHLFGKGDEWTEEELEQTAEAVGYGAVKYADLKNNRLTNYTFNFDQMLNDKGNTAVYLLYAHARICSIIRKSGKDMEELKKTGTLVLAHSDERALGLHLLQFAEIVEEACTNLLPNVLCEYLYNLSEDFTRFYSNCQSDQNPSAGFAFSLRVSIATESAAVVAENILVDSVYGICMDPIADSDEDSEDEEVVVLLSLALYEYYNMYIDHRPCRTSMLRGHDYVLEVLNGHEDRCHQNFRMKPQVFIGFCEALKVHANLKHSRYLTLQEQVCIFLLTIGHNERNRVVQERFQHSGHTISVYFHRVLKAVCKLGVVIIQPPSFDGIPHQIRRNSKYFPFFKDCVRAIDGTHISASVPASDQIPYRGKHTVTTQNVMAACSFDMRFTYVLSGWEGTTNDSMVFLECVNNPAMGFPKPPEGKYYVVDSGYTNMPGNKNVTKRTLSCDLLRSSSSHALFFFSDLLRRRRLLLLLRRRRQVVGSAEETSRLLLCEATAVVMRKCFHLLGIRPVYKIRHSRRRFMAFTVDGF